MKRISTFALALVAVAVFFGLLAVSTLKAPPEAPVRSMADPVAMADVATGGPRDPGTCTTTISTSAQLMAENSAAAGPLRVVCLADVAYNLPNGLKWTRANTILVGARGGDDVAARPTITGQITVAADNVTLRGLRFSWFHSNSPVRLWGDNLSLLESTVSNPRGICVTVGYLSAYQASMPGDEPGDNYDGYHKVHNILIHGNQIDGCANDPVFLRDQYVCGNDGLPGIYSQWTERMQITENVISNTALRGIQLFPFNKSVLIKDNLLRQNSVAMNIGTEAAYAEATSIDVMGNVFAEQSAQALVDTYPRMQSTCAEGKDYLRYNSPPRMTVVDNASTWPKPVVKPTVAISGNCGENVVKKPAESTFVWTNNMDAPATFASATDNHQANGSTCAQYGPVGLRAPADEQPPEDAPPVLASVSAPTRTIYRTITVRVDATDDDAVADMRLQNEDGVWSAWMPYAATTRWTLSNAQAQAKTVTVEVRDTAGATSNRVRAEVSFLPAHDLSGDSFNDVLLRRKSDKTMWLSRGTASDSPAEPTSMGARWAIFDKILVTRDFNGDGFTDVIVRVKRGHPDAGALRLYPGNNSGGFGAHSVISTGWGTFTQIVAPGDVTGDAKADLLAIRSNGTLALYPGTGTGRVLTAQRVGTATNWNARTLVTPGDFDGDFRADLMYRDAAGGLFLLPGNGGGGFMTSRKIGSGWNNYTPVGTGDMNNDQSPDLLARRNTDGTLWVYPGTGTGTFGPRYQVGTSKTWGSFDVIS